MRVPLFFESEDKILEISKDPIGQPSSYPSVNPTKSSELRSTNFLNAENPTTTETLVVVGKGIKSSPSTELVSKLQSFTQASEDNADKQSGSPERTTLDNAVSNVDSFLKAQNRELTFSIDEETDRSIVTVADAESGDIIRQIPSEEVLRLAERIRDLQKDVGKNLGVFIDNEV